MKRLLNLIIIVFFTSNFVQAQNWALSLSAKKQIIQAPHKNNNANFDNNTFYQIGVDKTLNNFFGLNTSIAYLNLSDANYFLEATYWDTLTLNIRNKISSNIFQVKISPFVYWNKNRSEISLRPSLGLGIIRTNQTILNELIQNKHQKTSVINDDYTYKTKITPYFGISLNYNYYFLENWSIGTSLGIEQLSSKTTNYNISSTNEATISKFPNVVQKDIEEWRAEEYRSFGKFEFIQIAIELKKRF
jgi:hypothetical protein